MKSNDDGTASTSHSSSLFPKPRYQWVDSVADKLVEAELLRYRSNLLGSDLSVTNFGGGNTSAKLINTDPLSGEHQEVLWVKGSGGDLGSMELSGFSSLYLSKLKTLEAKYREINDEDKMVEYLPHCTFDLNTRAASIDTPLHAYLPFRHIDHVHPDAIIALAAAQDGEKVVAELWGGSIGWLPWQRPGFDLGIKLRDYTLEHPDMRGVVLAGHGLICWADTSRACYENTLNIISDAVDYLNTQLGNRLAFGGRRVEPFAPTRRQEVAGKLMPRLRGLLSGELSKIGHFCDSDEVLEFVCSIECSRLAAIGTSCPDHFLRTKIKPMLLDFNSIEDTDYLTAAISAYRLDYQAYYQRCAKAGDPAIRDDNPVVILVPGVGCFTFAADKKTARLAAEFYCNAVNVMRGAELVGGYLGLDEKEAFNIEYWALEEAKLQRMPKPKPLHGQVAVITGGAGGIGKATALQLLSEGACVVALDYNAEALAGAHEMLIAHAGSDMVHSVVCDVTNEKQIADAFNEISVAFGGVDILVANAGVASSASVEETTLELWHKNYDVLVQGYFLTARAAFPLLKLQGGGAIIFIGSKNGLAASANASAYASAKSASLHLARCLALEGAPFGIRVNTVNPDAVIRGSTIWDGEWRSQRASTYGIDSGEELERHYRNRSLLKRDVFPQDVAEAVYFFASKKSGKSTGNMLNVDAGHAQAFTR